MSDDSMNVEGIIADMNSNMPINRRSLLDYLENGDLTYATRKGINGTFDRFELDYLAGICNEIEKMRFRLPIFVSTDSSSSNGAWKVEGIIEAGVVARILGKKLYREDYVRLHYPDLVELRKLLPNLVIILFLP